LFAVSVLDTSVQTEHLLDSVIDRDDRVIDSSYTEAESEVQHGVKLRLISETQHMEMANKSDAQPVEATVSDLSSAPADADAASDDDDDDDDEQRTFTREPVIAAEPRPSCADEFGILAVSNANDISVCFVLYRC